jgi:hypothetical protein
MEPRRCIAVIVLAASMRVTPALGQFVYAAVPGFQPASMSPQQTPVWCWAASIQAILRHHGISATQAEIVAATYGVVGELPAASPNVYLRALNGMRIKGDTVEVLWTSPAATFLASAQLANELNSGNPLLVWYATGIGSAHVVVLFGASFYAMNGYPATYTYWDPYPGVGVRTVNASAFNQVVTALNLIHGVRYRYRSSTASNDGTAEGSSNSSPTNPPAGFAAAVQRLADAAEQGEDAFEDMRKPRDRGVRDDVDVTLPSADRCTISKSNAHAVLCTFVDDTSLAGARAFYGRVLPWLHAALNRRQWNTTPSELADDEIQNTRFEKPGVNAYIDLTVSRAGDGTYSTFAYFRARQ